MELSAKRVRQLTPPLPPQRHYFGGQWQGYKVNVVAAVVGTMGLVCGLDNNLRRLGVFNISERVTQRIVNISG